MSHIESIKSTEAALASLQELREAACRARVKADAADETVLAAAVRLMIDTMEDPGRPGLHEVARLAGVTARTLRARLASVPGFEERLLEHLARTGAAG
jgi:hypothetical protein